MGTYAIAPVAAAPRRTFSASAAGPADAALQGRIYRGAARARMPAAPRAARTGADCVVIRPGTTYVGKQGPAYTAGVSGETAGATGICLHLASIPPGGRGHAHRHAGHETAIYVLSGVAEMLYGPRLERRARIAAGEFVYIPAGTPHLPCNPSAIEPMVSLIARTDPNEQESVELMPELDAALA